MVWSQPQDLKPQPKCQNLPWRTSSKRRPRRSSTSTTFTTTTGYTEDDHDHDDTTTYSQRPHPTIPLAYAPSEATDTTRTYTQISQSHISQTPHPSPDYQSQDLLIPSAQPTTPIFPLPSGPAFSASDEPSLLPSPPESLPSASSSPSHSRRTSSYGASTRRRSSTPAPAIEADLQSQTQPQSQVDQAPLSRGGTRGRSRGRLRGRGRGNSRTHTARPSTHHEPSQSTQEDTMDMSTLLEGIGRMHIAMNQDPAGRWRIKRHERDEYD